MILMWNLWNILLSFIFFISLPLSFFLSLFIFLPIFYSLHFPLLFLYPSFFCFLPTRTTVWKKLYKQKTLNTQNVLLCFLPFRLLQVLVFTNTPGTRESFRLIHLLISQVAICVLKTIKWNKPVNVLCLSWYYCSDLSRRARKTRHISNLFVALCEPGVIKENYDVKLPTDTKARDCSI